MEGVVSWVVIILHSPLSPLFVCHMLQEQVPTARVVLEVVASYVKSHVIDAVLGWAQRLVSLFTLALCLLPWSLRYSFVLICGLAWVYVAIQPFASLVSYRRVARRHKER